MTARTSSIRSCSAPIAMNFVYTTNVFIDVVFTITSNRISFRSKIDRTIEHIVFCERFHGHDVAKIKSICSTLFDIGENIEWITDKYSIPNYKMKKSFHSSRNVTCTQSRKYIDLDHSSGHGCIVYHIYPRRGKQPNVVVRFENSFFFVNICAL